MTTLREDRGPGPDEAGAGQRGGSGQPAGRPQLRLAAVTGLPALVRRHWLFSLALFASLLPRVVAMLGFQPAVLFRLDTFDYLWGAVHVSPNVVNPSGYSLFLVLLRPFHSLVLVVALQHLMGVATALMVYVVCRRYGLPAWGATLAAAPVLFDPAQILVEQFVMADLLAMVLMVGAFVLLLLRKSPSLWRSVLAGLLMGMSTTIRPTTLPLLILIPVYLLIRRVGWWRAGAALVAGAMPVLAYMSWFDAVHGSFNMSNSNGLFLWSRTMSFADCKVIRPPADLQALCPTAQPGALSQPDPAKRKMPKYYLWNKSTWEWEPPVSAPVPDTAAFTQANNARALKFAIKAIEAQPTAYAGVVLKEFAHPFVKTNILRFPGYQPNSSVLDEQYYRYAMASVKAYTGNDQGVTFEIGNQYGTHLHPPFGYLMTAYQRGIYMPAPVFGILLVTGLVGLFLPRRRTLAAAFLWISAIIIMLLPTAEHEYTYRYVIPAVPLITIAAALALRKPGRETVS